MKSIPIREIQETQVNVEGKKGFNIRRFEELQAGKGIVQSLHRHNFFYFLAIEKGEGAHYIDFSEHNIIDHSIFFMRPGQVHEYDFKPGGRGFLLAFQPDFYPYYNDIAQRNTLRQVSRNNHYQLDATNFQYLKNILEAIYIEFENKPKNFEKTIRSYLNIVMITLDRTITPAHVTQESSYESERLDQLLEFIEINISKTKKVVDYAGLMNMTTHQLNTIIKKLLGKTCSDLISEQVILESKRILLSTSNQVNEVAFQLGFDDPAYFIRFFKKHAGDTPQSFRNNFK